jgi:hypothetical protein
MGLLDWLFSANDDDDVRRDRYGHDRENGGGPRVKSGPTEGLIRARNKDGSWRRKHDFD